MGCNLLRYIMHQCVAEGCRVKEGKEYSPECKQPAFYRIGEEGLV